MTKNEQIIRSLKCAIKVEQTAVELNTITTPTIVSHENNITVMGLAIEALSTKDPRIQEIVKMLPNYEYPECGDAERLAAEIRQILESDNA